MPYKSIPNRLLIPEDPSFRKDCVAHDANERRNSTLAKLGDFLTVVKLKQPERVQKREVAIAVMGPIICDACVHSCTKATALVPRGPAGESLMNQVTFDTVKEAATSASAHQILNPRSPFTNKLSGGRSGTTAHGPSKQGARRAQDATDDDAESDRQEPEPFISSHDKDLSRMIDDVLDLQAGQPVTVSPRGELVIHPDGYQQQMPLETSPVFRVVEGADNQFRLEY